MIHYLFVCTVEALFPKLNNTERGPRESVTAPKHMVLYMPGVADTNSASNLLSNCVSCKLYANSTLESLGYEANSSATESVLS